MCFNLILTHIVKSMSYSIFVSLSERGEKPQAENNKRRLVERANWIQHSAVVNWNT